VHLTGVPPHGRVSHGRVPYEHISHERVPHGRTSHGRVPHGRVPHLRVFLARMTWVARIPISTPKDVLKLLNCGRLGRQAAGHPWSALRVMKSCRKTAQRPRCCSKLKQQLWYQSSLSNYLQRGRVRRGKKRRQSDWLANQMDRKVMDRHVIERQVEDRQTDRSKQGR
jgi:hypothetical protein